MGKGDIGEGERRRKELWGSMGGNHGEKEPLVGKGAVDGKGRCWGERELLEGKGAVEERNME